MANSTLTDPLNLSATVIMIVNGIFGLVCNALIVFIFVKLPGERTSFNLICVFRGIANSIILLWTFFGTFIPSTFLGETPFSPEYQTIVIGTCNSIYTSLQYSGLLIACNRYWAMFFPMYYSKVFSFKFTLAFTIIVFGYEIVRVIYEFIAFVIRVKCFLIFSTSLLQWIPDMADECEKFVDKAIDKTAIFLLAMVAVNIATFTKIFFFYKASELDAEESRKKVKKNRSLFLQTMFQDSIILADMLFTFRLSVLSEQRIWTFFCGTFIWECVHSLDGFIMVMFNERLATLKRIFFPPQSRSSVVIQSKVASSEKVSPRHSNPAPIN